MTPEERFERIEKQIEFIVNKQAEFYARQTQFYADLSKLEEQVNRNSEQMH
ncbi:hypothetical protein MYX78_10690 [Acidobacteria bacterium AH-259-G07]|nr:hypothetical protein [Acidobacteria bacterium AH-259-G07]